MIHEILPVGLLQCNCSILGDEAGRKAIVVDPGDNIEEILEILEETEVGVEVASIAEILELDQEVRSEERRVGKECRL